MQNMHSMRSLKYACYTRGMESQADTIRDTARKFIVDARNAGLTTVTILAGELVKELHFQNCVPNVCSALGSKIFQRQNQMELIRREGPPSGQSTTTRFTYRLAGQSSPKETEPSAFMSLRGAGKQVFQALGGGEAFLKKEREEFDGR